VQTWGHISAAIGGVVALIGGCFDADKYRRGADNVDIMQAIVIILVSSGVTIVIESARSCWAAGGECCDKYELQP
jgi:hypothetical protein